MLEIFGTNYYIDVDTIIETCRPNYPTEEITSEPPPEKSEVLTEAGDAPVPEASSNSGELNIFKFEVLKACVERVLGEYEETDENLGAFAQKSASPSFKIAFNTLLKYEILKEENE